MINTLMNETTDVCQIKRGDRSAINELFEAYRIPVTRFISRYVRDAHLAEDLCQDTFLRVYQNLERLRVDGNLRNWIFTIARNSTLDCLRRRKRSRLVLVEVLEKGYHCDPFDFAAEHEEAGILTEAMGRLTEHERFAFVRKESDGETFREIGVDLNCTISHVRTLIRHAKGVLKEAMPELYSFPQAG